MPIPRRDGGFKCIHDHAMWLVSYFEGLVLERTNQELVAKGKKPADEISEHRKQKWLRNAIDLVSAHPLVEVVAVIDRLFTTWYGWLPHSVVAERFDVVRPANLKLTRLAQIQENYDGLVREMDRCDPAYPIGEAERVQVLKINYGQPFAESADEARVTELLALFTEFRLTVSPRREIHHTESWRWAKSFRIMLDYHGYDFAEVKDVVTALRDHPDMDRARYGAPFDMYQSGEWEHLVAAAGLARLRAERQTSGGPAPDRRRPKHVPGRGRGNAGGSEDGPRYLDMSARTPRPPGYNSRNRTGSPGRI